MAVNKIQVTKNYRLFSRDGGENRPVDVKKHKKLRESMERYGFLRCFPVVVRREGARLVVKDGQHRLELAESLSLPVYWVEEEVDFDVAVINCTPKVWTVGDYARKHAANGLAAYQEGIDFAERHRLPLGTAFALLAGTTSFGNCQDAFTAGTFEVKDRPWADLVAGLYGPMIQLSPLLRNSHFIAACMAVCRVAQFDPRRMLACAKRRREALSSYSTRDAYLGLLEEVYNYGRHTPVPLRFMAVAAMKERNATGGRGGAAAAANGLQPA